MGSSRGRHRVLIAGGGVAALEAMVALRTLAKDRVDIELLSPDQDFFYRPLAVAEPFGRGGALRFDLRALATGCGARHRLGSLASVDAAEHRARTGRGESLPYDSLVVATGARRQIALPRALTYRGSEDTAALSRILDEARSGEVETIGFVVPSGVTWPLPLYELALQTASQLAEEAVEARIAFLTHEERPLAVFGHEGSRVVAELLADRRIELRTSIHAERFEDGLVHLVHRAPLALEPCVIARPRLIGVPLRASHAARGSCHSTRPSDVSPRSTTSTRPETGRASRSSKAVSPLSKPMPQPR